MGKKKLWWGNIIWKKVSFSLATKRKKFQLFDENFCLLDRILRKIERGGVNWKLKEGL